MIYTVFVQMVAIVLFGLSLTVCPLYQLPSPHVTVTRHSTFAYLFLDVPSQLAGLLLFDSALIADNKLRAYYLSPVLGVHIYDLLTSYGASKLKDIDVLDLPLFATSVDKYLV